MSTICAGIPAPRRPRGQWLAPTGLILLSLIPVIAGAARLTELTGGASATEQNIRFLDSPIPVAVHIVSATVYAFLGAFQFVPSLRRRGSSWHRIAGRVLVPAGLFAAVSGLWMAVFYSFPNGDGTLLLVIRLVFGSAMAASIVLGLLAILRRDFIRHGAWMTRAYALGVAAGTQAVVLALWIGFVGPTEPSTRAVLMGTAWAINLTVAESVIRHRARLLRIRSRTLRPVGAGPALVSSTTITLLEETK
ncbi:DUF2306 domain-containing protein [Arthrobacter sp. CG_A4]|uniref:DUF2306 domain-containing protein n=1 Tax=Arthrobacter sp. CG_A4 TaxID=3071706 RepID=UPI002DFECB85|nr:putative membrane protein [Arthrobacter sp. CG_A4]